MRRLLFSFLLLSTLAFGQTNCAVLSGTVSDPQGKAFAGADLEITSASTQAVRRVSSNGLGLFDITGLPPGDYELKVDAPGFAPLTQTLRLEVGQQMVLNLNLKVASVKNTVEVADVPPALHPTDASVGEVIEPVAVHELPLNGRMLVDLMLTVPGSHVSHGAQTGNMNPLYWRPGQRSAVSIGGNRPNANYFLLDGTTNTDPTFNTLNLSPSPDTVQEFKVQTGSYSAEMGGAGGGQVNIVTRSGSNSFHGTAYEFLRNGAMDATSFDSMGNNHMVQNNFGASFGGPIVHKRTFFFANYEGFHHAMANTMIDTVPTPAEIAGDFSQSGVNIYDPTNGRAQFQYNGVLNYIPPTQINTAAQTFLQKYVPQPNVMMGTMPCGAATMGSPGVVGAGVDCNNYMDVRNELEVNNQGTIRIDQNLAHGDTVTGRYSLSAETGFMPGEMPPGGVGTLLPGFGSYNDNFSQQGNIAWTRVLSSTLVNTAAISVSRLAMHRYDENAYTNDIVTELGIQGVGFGGAGAYGAPFFNVQGYSPMGDNYSATPMKAWDTMIEGRDGLSWQHGRHGLQFGGSYRRFIWPMWGFFQNRGYYQFTNGFTTDNGTNDGTGSALASFLLGLPAVKQRQAGIPQMQLRQWYADGFVQDTFRMTPTTTIEMGLRYEFMDPLVDLTYPNSNLIINNGVPSAFIGGQNGFPKGLKYPNARNFAPRFGISKAFPARGVVLHGAYGIFFTPVDMNTWCNQRHNVPYVFSETQQSDNFTPAAPILASQLNFGEAVLGQTTVSFTAMDPHAPSQYIEQWSGSVEKSLGHQTTLELGYLGSHGVHLQRAHLINNAPPGPGAIGPRRPFPKVSFVAGTVLPTGVTYTPPASGCPPDQVCFPVSTINLLENSAQSWYDAGYVNVRRRYSHGLTFLANYTWAKNLSDAPDFRSPMFESSIPQNNSDLGAERGPGCDIRHRFAISAVYDLPAWDRSGVVRAVTKDWHLSTVYQVQTGFPFTISVFGDTANSGTVLGENPIRANATGQSMFGAGTRNANAWFNTAAFAAPPAYTFGDVGRNSVYGPGLQTLDWAIVRDFSLTERARFQFRGEFFNALNHTNLGTPDRFVNTPQFGTITEATTPGREIQLSARLSF
ncbi:MAG TPA: carboxypeptidase-like regulatory domain-containing protein [Candidatus Sulfotelmatobacter sp.]|nr:carboxypeptidase-like regulatory domain-containing protein [Candidatus Sulfotelmatobacter sp.]